MRELSNDFITASIASSNRPVFFLEVVLSDLTLNLCTAPTDLTWDSKTWLGNGWMHPHVGPRETKDLDSNGVEVTLTGLPQDLLAAILGNTYQGTNATLYFGFMDDDFAVIDLPYLAFQGTLDVPVVDENPDGSMVTISFESAILEMERPREFYYNPESQKIWYPTDKGFDEVGKVAQWDGFWGKKKKRPRANQADKQRRHTRQGSRKGR